MEDTRKFLGRLVIKVFVKEKRISTCKEEPFRRDGRVRAREEQESFKGRLTADSDAE